MKITNRAQTIFDGDYEYIRLEDSDTYWIVHIDGEWYDITNAEKAVDLEKEYQEKMVEINQQRKVVQNIEEDLQEAKEYLKELKEG